MMEQILSEKDILQDALTTEKMSTATYNTFSNECVHPQVRNVMRQILDDEHDIQEDVFQMMHERGMYPTPGAEEKKVQEAKAKYASGLK